MLDSDAEYVESLDMLAELAEDDKALTARFPRPTTFATNIATSRQQASLKSASTKPNAEPGSCSKRRDTGIEPPSFDSTRVTQL